MKINLEPPYINNYHNISLKPNQGFLQLDYVKNSLKPNEDVQVEEIKSSIIANSLNDRYLAAVLENVYNTLADGGKFILSVIDHRAFALDALTGKASPEDIHNVLFNNPFGRNKHIEIVQIISLLKDIGFKNMSISYDNIVATLEAYKWAN